MGLVQNIKKRYQTEGIKGLYNFFYWAISARLTHGKHIKEDQAIWDELKDAFKGERVFLIGNGPSLNKTPLYFLKNENTICFNRFNLLLERLDWNPTMYMIVDGLVAQDMIEEINELVEVAQIAFIPDVSKFYNINLRSELKPNEKIKWLYAHGSQLDDLAFPYLNLGGSVAIGAAKVLMHLGFSEIYLIGVDMNYKIHETAKNLKYNDIQSKDDDDPNHFDPRYFGKNRKYHQPTSQVVNYIFESFDKLSIFATDRNQIIKNATVGGKLESFERVDFNDLFEYTEEQKFKLFSDAIYNITGTRFKSIEDLLTIPMVKSLDKLDSDIDSFLVESNLVDKFIPKLIFDYVPFGPFQGKHIFIKKK